MVFLACCEFQAVDSSDPAHYAATLLKVAAILLFRLGGTAHK
ncbi:hypothetical Protein YC6258_04064 [Gynuella sunshinyii YC6258]|uniref:Uncharacterized protein n=1 Tax=Gynuella sunshinyii YC6258 TaxID=1445510 RepID=A0A0C5VPA7_9GAMM|nr:hypothetical Protein YC6258_04064 [Gynuella sunshinyii YC6258]